MVGPPYSQHLVRNDTLNPTPEKIGTRKSEKLFSTTTNDNVALQIARNKPLKTISDEEIQEHVNCDEKLYRKLINRNQSKKKPNDRLRESEQKF